MIAINTSQSSVLEGLTDLPFPRDSGLCTRFATQITFRRDLVKRINISIIPGRNSTDEHAAAVKAFVRNDLEHLEAATFAQIMREVKKPLSQGKLFGLTFHRFKSSWVSPVRLRKS